MFILRKMAENAPKKTHRAKSPRRQDGKNSLRRFAKILPRMARMTRMVLMQNVDHVKRGKECKVKNVYR